MQSESKQVTRVEISIEKCTDLISELARHVSFKALVLAL
jgi:hypothetical protein